MKAKQKKNINPYIILTIITLLGGYLRICNLGINPLFPDSAFFGMLIRNNIWSQEQFPHFIIWILNHDLLLQQIYSQFNVNPDIQLNLPFAVCGILSIPLVYFIVKQNKWVAVLFIAFNPLFVFWDGMARPYAMAGFLSILAWRFKWFYIPALLTTPISLITFNKNHKNKKILFIVLFSIAITAYLIRPDIHYQGWDRNLWSIFQTSARWWYLPLISLTLYSCDYIMPFCKNLIYGDIK